MAWKIVGVALVLLAFVAAGAVWSVRQVNEVHKEVEALVQYYIPIEQLIHRLEIDVHEERCHLERALRLVGDPTSRDLVRREREEMLALDAILSEEMDRILGLVRDAEASRLSKARRLQLGRIDGRLVTLIEEHEDLRRQTEAYLADAGGGASAGLLREREARFDGAVRKLGEDMDAFVLEASATAAAHERRALVVSVALTALAAFVGLFAAAWVTRLLVRPVLDLVEATGSVQEGRLDTEVDITTRDEIGGLGYAFNGMVEDLRMKRRVEETFGRFLDPRVMVDLLEKDEGFRAAGQKREVTVLFIDLRGFTSVSERLTADNLVKLLNEFLAAVSGPIRAEGGVVDKFIGDSVMAYWCAPFVGEGGHAAMACRAALQQASLLGELNEGIRRLTGIPEGLPELDFRIGINSGEAVVGSVGPEHRKEYTVIGDPVNLASRLEGANKAYGTRVIVSEATRDLAGDEFEFRELDRIRVKGKRQPVRVFELLSVRGGLDTRRGQVRDQFAEGLGAYFRQDWEAASVAFGRVLDLDPDDGPSRVFAGRVRELQADPPGTGWDGVWELGEGGA